MNSDLIAAAQQLQLMDASDEGESPGFDATCVRTHLNSLGVVPSVVSVDELYGALALSQNVDSMDIHQMLRVMLVQNDVLIRDAIWRRSSIPSAQQFQSPSVTSTSSSLLSSLTTSGGSSGSTPQSVHSRGESSASSSFQRLKIAPPKNFRCPLCPSVMNEKDFDRHILAWLSKVHKVGPVKSGHCPGIRDADHELLQRFPHGSVADRVGSLVADIRSLVRPGAYDSMSSSGSGRDVVVAARFAELMTPH